MAARKKADPNHVVVEVRHTDDRNGRLPSAAEAAELRAAARVKIPVDGKEIDMKEKRGGLGMDMSYKSDIASTAEMPRDVQEALAHTDAWIKKNLFVDECINLKVALWNYGFGIAPAEKVDKKKKKDLERWCEVHEEKLTNFVTESWTDAISFNNIVAFWRKKEGQLYPVGDPRIITIPPHQCRYSDALGIPRLRVKLGWSKDDFIISGKSPTQRPDVLLDKEELKRYASGGEVELLESQGEYFKVYKEARVGWGFRWPRFSTLFHTCAQIESQEVGDRLQGFLCRTVLRQHLIGHEIKTGPRAGLPMNFMKEPRAKETLNFFSGRIGALDYCTNFDQKVEFPFPSNDRFDKEKYDSGWLRIALHYGPVGLYLHSLLIGRGSMPFIMEGAQAEAEKSRKNIRRFLTHLIQEVFRPPVKIKVYWSNRIFQDRRQIAEIAKALLTAGPLSQRTALEQFDYCPEEEREFKAEEAKLPPEQTRPTWDSSHGIDPSNPMDTGGRPAGTKDSGPRVALNGHPED
jgi:hypothetical protein